MNRCPELHDLHAFVDGQLDAERWRLLDGHQRDCADCRDELRSIARLNRELLRPTPAILPADFEDGFREGLYARMVASDDVGRLRRLQRRDLVLAGAVAALLVVAVSIALRPGDSGGAEGPAAVLPDHTAAARLEGGRRLRAELGRYLDRLGPAGPEEGDPLLDELATSYVAAGRNLVSDLSDEAAVSSADREAAALMTLVELGDPAGALAIGRLIEAGIPPGQRLESALRALVATGSSGAPERIVAAEAAGLPLGVALGLLDSCDRSHARRLMTDLVRVRMIDRRDETVAGLAALESETATRLLIDLAFEGQTSSLVADALADRPGVRDELRRRALSRSLPLPDRRRAIELLGRMRDTESRADLVSLSRRREFSDAATAALAAIGGIDHLNDLVLGLDVVGSRGIEGTLARNGDLLERLAALGEEAAVEIRRRLLDETMTAKGRHILALGRCGDSSDLELIARFALRPEYEKVALSALVLLDLEAGRDILRGFLRHRDADLRRLAREALRLLDWRPEPAARWSGFAALIGEFDVPGRRSHRA